MTETDRERPFKKANQKIIKREKDNIAAMEIWLRGIHGIRSNNTILFIADAMEVVEVGHKYMVPSLEIVSP